MAGIRWTNLFRIKREIPERRQTKAAVWRGWSTTS